MKYTYLDIKKYLKQDKIKKIIKRVQHTKFK